MKDIFYRDIIEKLPIGYAYNRIICDDSGNPCDYEFIEVNEIFEKITGLKSIIGKKVSNVLPSIRKNEFSWINFYGDLALNGGQKEFEQYSENLNRWYKGVAYSPKKGYFITLFMDVTDKMRDMEELKTILTVLNDIVFELNEEYVFNNIICSNEDSLFMPKDKIIGKKVQEIFSRNLSQLFITTFEKAVDSRHKEIINYKSPLPNDERFFKAEIKYIKNGRGNKFVVSIGDITEQKKLQEELSNKEYKLERFFSVNLDLLCIADLEGNFLEVNDEWVNMLGYPKEELEGRKFMDFVHPDDIEKTKKAISKLNEKKRLLNFVNRYRCSNGSYRYIEWRSRLYDNYIYAAARDITAKIKAKKKLRESRERIENIIKGTNVGTWEWNVQTGETVFNERWAEIIGYKLDDLKPISTETWNNFVHPDDLEKVNIQLNQVFEHKKDYYDIECRMKHKDGHWVWIQDRGKVVSWATDGKPLMMSGTHSEITKRKKIENELKKSEEKYRLIFEHSPLGVFHYDSKGIITDCNEKFIDIIGSPKDVLVGLNTLNLPDKRLVNAIKKSLQGELSSYEGYYQAYTSGKTTPLRIRFGPIITDDNKIEGGSSILEDITEYKKMEEIIFNEKEKFRTALLSVSDGVISSDNYGDVLIMNKMAEKMTGWCQEKAYGRTIEEVLNIINETTREKCENPAKEVLKSMNVVEIQNHTILISTEGIERPIEGSASPIKDINGDTKGVVMVFRDVTEKKRQHEYIKHLSYRDQLTGLYNRRFFEEELNRLDVANNLPLSLIMADVNGLKLANDAFGHLVGDEVLKRFAEILNMQCRTGDTIARIGGDEFVIILPKTKVEQTKEVVNRIKQVTSKEKVKSIDLSISFGCATKKCISDDIEKVFTTAENNMYQRKLYESQIMRGNTINTIIHILHKKLPIEKMHSERVSIICEKIAVELGFDNDSIAEIKMAGLMHDIGKITLNESILHKKEKLKEEEWLEIKRHPEAGYQILRSVNEKVRLAEYVLAHHENWNGSGYPKGLKGIEIPLQARIIRVADSYDAMISKRCYKNSISKEEAIKEIKRNIGIEFDPDIATLFINKIFPNLQD